MSAKVDIALPTGPQQPPAIGKPIHGAPLNAQAAKAAARTHTTAKDILTLMAVLSAGASVAFFFSAIFVTSAFTIPFVISIVATIVFGFAGEGNKKPRPAGNPYHPPYVPPPPGKGVFGNFFAPPEPPPEFVDGQPVQLTNGGSTCFIDATFQEMMNWPEMKDALIDSYQEWDARLTAFSKLGAWLKQHDEAAKPTAEDIPLLITVLASADFGSSCYDRIRAKAAEASEPLNLLYAYIKAFRDARHKGEDDPEIAPADIGKILPLFEYVSDWTPQNIDAFNNISRWLTQLEEWIDDPKHNPQPLGSPRPADLVDAFMRSPEHEARYRQIFDDPKAKLPKFLKALHAKVTQEIEKQKKDEPAKPPVEQFFDFHCAAHFVRNVQASLPTLGGVKGFLAAVATYDKTCADKKLRTNITLEAMRGLMPEARRRGQQDSTELLGHLCNLIDIRKYPRLFFAMSIERRNIPDGPKEAAPLPSHNRKGPAEPTFQFQIAVPNEPSLGQELFDALFEFQQFDNPEIAVYDKQRYKIDAERFVVDNLPDAFLLSLKRFGIDSKGRRVKNSQPVVMPEYLTRGDDTFEVTAIVQHNGNSPGGGHYIALVKKEDGSWWECDDGKRYIRPASEATLKYALTYGYQYLVKKCGEPAPVLKEWPPK